MSDELYIPQEDEQEELLLNANEEGPLNVDEEARGAVVVKDYNALDNKPSINGVTLEGNTIIAEDKTYLHEQSVPSKEWNVQHNLGKYPAVTVVDSAGTEVVGSVEHIDHNTVKLTFSGAFSGKAFFN